MRRSSLPNCLTCWLLLALMAFLSGPAAAESAGAPTNDLYQAYEIVTGTDMRQRPWGFAQCLREVLVKVSGDPKLRDDPRVAELAEHADRFVTAFDYVDLMAAYKKKDDQGSYDRPHRLTVHFDPQKIDAEIVKLGDQPWRGERPVVVPVLLVRGRKPPDYVLSAEIPAGADQRGAFVNAAAEFGITARIPTDTELGALGVAADKFPPAATALPGAKPGEVIVIGTLEWSEALPGWVGSWRTNWHGADYGWDIRGVNYDGAFRDIVRGVVLLASGRGSPN